MELTGLNILVISNDHRERQKLYIDLLNGQNSVDTASTYIEGQDKVSMSEFDLVICQHDTPDRDGLKIYQTLRHGQSTTPFMLLTDAQQNPQDAATDPFTNDPHAVSIETPECLHDLKLAAKQLPPKTADATPKNVLE